jgi:serine/threonine-protein kinase
MPTRTNRCDLGNLRLLAEGALANSAMPELEEHLEHCAECRARLDQMTSDDRWAEAVRENLTPETGEWEAGLRRRLGALDFLAPTDWPDSLGRLGSYEVKGVLGRGGMGVVLKAFDPALHRNVAIKVLSESFAASGAARARFLREARAAAAVAHEHVVAVHAVDERGGLPFLVMEYIPGRSLQDRIDRDGPLLLAEILRIGMQTASGLAAAHAQGLVHRDIKPANILLENGVERVRLTDFGLARAAADAGVTQSGVVAGTPHYMAPEQARAEAIDHRADLFSLGSTLYAMCTGHPPFRADSAVAVLRRVSDDRPRPIREINPEIPIWLERLIERLHAKEPADRYASAEEVAGLLGRCLAHVREPLSSPLPPELSTPDSRLRSGRFKWRRWAAAGLALAFVLGGILAVLHWRDPRSGKATVNRDPFAPASHVPSRSRANLPSAPDEIEHQIAEAQNGADAIRARLTTGIDHDSFAAFVDRLSVKADLLEREVAASTEGGGSRDSVPFRSSPKP